jgi:hypothetical protein
MFSAVPQIIFLTTTRIGAIPERKNALTLKVHGSSPDWDFVFTAATFDFGGKL